MGLRRSERAEAEKLYIGSEKSLDEVAAETGVPRATIGLWSTHGRWKEKRAQSHTDPYSALEALERRRERLMLRLDKADAKDAPRLMDAIYKCTSTIECMEKGTCSVAVLLAIFRRFAEFAIAEADHATRVVLATWIEKFLEKMRLEASRDKT